MSASTKRVAPSAKDKESSRPGATRHASFSEIWLSSTEMSDISDNPAMLAQNDERKREERIRNG